MAYLHVLPYPTSYQFWYLDFPTRLIMDMSDLSVAIQGCHDCYARREAQQPLVPAGHLQARVMVVLRNPGTEEDQRGTVLEPTEAYAHVLLHMLYTQAKIPVEDLYFTYAMFCHTCENRKPLAQELGECRKFKLHEWRILPNIRYILLLGDDVMRQFGFGSSIIKNFWSIYRYELPESPVYIVPCYHPMKALLHPEFMPEYGHFFQEFGEVYRAGPV